MAIIESALKHIVNLNSHHARRLIGYRSLQWSSTIIFACELGRGPFMSTILTRPSLCQSPAISLQRRFEVP